jgi:hypothetical protein
MWVLRVPMMAMSASAEAANAAVVIGWADGQRVGPGHRRRVQRCGVVLAQHRPQLIGLPLAGPDEVLVAAGEHLDGFGKIGITGDLLVMCPVQAHQFRQHVRIARSDFAPEVEYRSRYRAACIGLIAYTCYPAAINAATHGPRSVSMPTTTSEDSASSGR